MVDLRPTYVIEIQRGQGDPLQLTLWSGEELSPMSVGRQGGWRIDAGGIADVHAYVYFDGTTLYLQSAVDGKPVRVEGRSIPREWTKIAVPSSIAIGDAILEYREQVPLDEGETSVFPQVSGGAFSQTSLQAHPEFDHGERTDAGVHWGPDSAPTKIAAVSAGPPRVARSPLASDPGPPPREEPTQEPVTAPRRVEPRPLPLRVESRIEPRPTPSEPPSEPLMEPTMVLPLAEHDAAPPPASRGGAGPALGQLLGAPGAAVGPPAFERGQYPAQPPGTTPYAPPNEPDPRAGFGAGGAPGQPFAAYAPPAAYGGSPQYPPPQNPYGHQQHEGFAPLVPPPGVFGAMPNLVPQGAFPSPAVPSPGLHGPSHGLIDVPVTAIPAPAAKPSPLHQLKAQWRETSLPKKITALLLPVGFVALVFAFDQPKATKKKPRQRPTTSASATSSSAPVASDTRPRVAATNPDIAPSVTSQPRSVPPATSGMDPGGGGPVAAIPTSRDAGPVADGGKTPERLAADAVSAGSFAEAARLYDELARAHPANPAYREASRILRAKAEANPKK